ncbi:MAG: ATP-binding cassette domain-containing protein [Sandaracinaceae bacterium]|nr:ATP-binding cassette domain-containing protein [Sandaracinaceae bacterium]
MAEPALECVDVDKRYPDGAREVHAVRGVTMRVEPGSLTLLRGPSGCGKTTLLSLLGGMIAPSAGEIRVLGRSIVRLRDRHRAALRRDEVGFVFQELALVPEMSVDENLFLPLVPIGGPSAEDEARLAQRLERIGLSRHRGTIAKKLSGGERQRVAILRALVLDPPVLLLDEPTAHLDAASTAELLAWLDELRTETTHLGGKRTIVVATHDPRVIDHAGVDRVIAMADGRVASVEDRGEGAAAAPVAPVLDGAGAT